MEKLSPQKEIIVSALRDLRFHCGREWLDHIKDDRKRISELNEGYMHAKGYQIIGEPCKGTACGNHKCPLFKRKAVKLQQAATPTPQRSPIPAAALEINKQALAFFDSYPA